LVRTLSLLNLFDFLSLSSFWPLVLRMVGSAALRAPRGALVLSPEAPWTERPHPRAARPVRRALPAPRSGRAGRHSRADGRLCRRACGPRPRRIRGRAQDVGMRARSCGLPRRRGRPWIGLGGGDGGGDGAAHSWVACARGGLPVVRSLHLVCPG
jgi:hypothetical protein